jgi:high-affinity K+ transport system ATPase subunit B
MRKVGISDDASDMDTIVLDMEDTISQQNQLARDIEVALSHSQSSRENATSSSLMFAPIRQGRNLKLLITFYVAISRL